MGYQNAFHKDLAKKIEKHGRAFNAHAHIDRFGTAKAIPYEGLTMIEKQGLTGRLHKEKAYSREFLMKRMGKFLQESVDADVRRVDSFIDIGLDIELDNGLGALNCALDLKKQFKGKIDFRVGAYPIMGFSKGDTKAWDNFVQGAKKADFLGLLPERDDNDFYKISKDHIGFEEHFKRVLELAVKLNKPAHFHLDQQKNPMEFGTETLIEAIRWSDYKEEIIAKGKEKPFIWAVHSISPSTYSDERFQKMLEGLAKYNVGVVVCPSAALSMRQLEGFQAPIGNCIARVLEMLAAGIPVRIGTDNVDDMFLPSTTLDPVDEITLLSNAVRFYNPSILAKITCGKKLDPDDISLLKRHLKENKETVTDAVAHYT